MCDTYATMEASRESGYLGRGGVCFKEVGGLRHGGGNEGGQHVVGVCKDGKAAFPSSLITFEYALSP